jgi:hypothetical protein
MGGTIKFAGSRALLGAESDEDVNVDGSAGGQRLSKHERRTRAMQVRNVLAHVDHLQLHKQK